MINVGFVLLEMNWNKCFVREGRGLPPVVKPTPHQLKRKKAQDFFFLKQGDCNLKVAKAGNLSYLKNI